jgi:hypothetical protein
LEVHHVWPGTWPTSQKGKILIPYLWLLQHRVPLPSLTYVGLTGSVASPYLTSLTSVPRLELENRQANLYWEVSPKFVNSLQFWLKPNKNNEHFTWRSTWVLHEY